MLLKPVIQDLKKTINNLKKIAVDFENGTINIKTLLAKITAIQATFSLETLEDSLELTLGNPENLRKKTIIEACTVLCAFKARMLEIMTATMQKLMTMRPRVPLRRYGGNVVETTPAALTVALAYANKLVNESASKNLAANCLASFKTALTQLEELVVLHHNNIIATAATRERIVEMLPAHRFSALRLQADEDRR